jgi:hypothetical protein
MPYGDVSVRLLPLGDAPTSGGIGGVFRGFGQPLLE